MPLHALELVPDDAGMAAARRDWQALRDAGLPPQLGHPGPINAPHLMVDSATDLPWCGGSATNEAPPPSSSR